MSLLRICAIFLVVTTGAVEVGSSAIGVSVEPTYLSIHPFKECERRRNLACQELALRALEGLRLLVSSVASTDVHTFTIEDVLKVSAIDRGYVSQRDYGCIRDFVRGILHTVYPPRDVYNILVEWNQSFSGDQVAFRSYWKDQAEERAIVVSTANLCSAVLWYTKVFEPFVNRPLQDTAVGFPTIRLSKNPVTVVVPPKEALVEMIKHMADTMSETKSLKKNDSSLLGKRGNTLEGPLKNLDTIATTGPSGRKIRREVTTDKTDVAVLDDSEGTTNDIDDVDLLSFLESFLEDDPKESVPVTSGPATADSGNSSQSNTGEPDDDISVDQDLVNLVNDEKLSGFFGFE